MPSFTNVNNQPHLDHFHHLDFHFHQFMSASIIRNWHLDSQNTSITSCQDLCGAAFQLCTCPAIFFPHTHRTSRLQLFLNIIEMAIADVLFLPWPHWAQLTFVR